MTLEVDKSPEIEVQWADSDDDSPSSPDGKKGKVGDDKKSEGRSNSEEKKTVKIIELPFDMRRITRLEN